MSDTPQVSYDFYEIDLDLPLSRVHNTRQWRSSTIGRLNAQTNGEIYIRELPQSSRNFKYAWRIVDAEFSAEDSLITYFRAFGLNEEYLPHATFGVNFTSSNSRIGGGFKHQLEFGNSYYVPVENKFPTPNTGGYTVQVLDYNYPSEGLSFGMFKQGAQHQNLIVTFRLFELGADYPNDI